MSREYFEPENDIETSLIKAADDINYRNTFYRDFLESDVYALINKESSNTERLFFVTENTEIEYIGKRMQGKMCLPIFTSLKRLNHYIRQNKMTYIKIPARHFLESIDPTVTVMLNLNSAYGKEFTPLEIKHLLDGTIFNK